MHSAKTQDDKETHDSTIKLKIATIDTILVSKKAGSKSQRKKAKGMSSENIAEYIKEDIATIIRLRSQTITAGNIQGIINSLEKLLPKVQQISDKNARQEINQLLRIFKI